MIQPTVRNVKKGIEYQALCTADLVAKTNLLVRKNISAPKTPEMPGAMTQAANTCDTPVHPQLILVMPIDAVADPTRPPMIECVVETGMPYLVATVRNVEDARMVQNMARSRTGGELS